jgi:hypothetical protein
MSGSSSSDTRVRTEPGVTSPTASSPGGPPPPERPPVERERRRPMGWGLVLILAGVLWSLALTGVDLRWEVLLPGAVVLVGVLVLAAGRWWSVDGLIGLGIVLAVASLAVVVVPGPVSFTAGDRSHEPTVAAELEPEHTLGAGTLTIDLRSVELPDGVTELSAQVGFGELILLVPADATIRGTASVAAGETSAFGRTRGGVAPTQQFDEPGGAAGPVLDLQLRVGFGRIEVDR